MGRAAGRKRGFRERRGLTFGLVVAFCLFAGAFLFLRSSYFSIRDFQVQGNSRVSRDEIVARSGQTAPNIFAFDVDKASRLIESSPWIEKATVTRRFPATIAIAVNERLPVAFTPIGDSMWLVDAVGRLLAQDDGTFRGLVALTGPATQGAAGGFLDAGSYGWGLRVLSCLGPLSRKKLVEINVQDGEPALILDDGCRVLMGRERQDPEARASLLESILEELAKGGRMAERVDLRYEKPAVKDFVQTPKR